MPAQVGKIVDVDCNNDSDSENTATMTKYITHSSGMDEEDMSEAAPISAETTRGSFVYEFPTFQPPPPDQNTPPVETTNGNHFNDDNGSDEVRCIYSSTSLYPLERLA